jgi:hypothetical protein
MGAIRIFPVSDFTSPGLSTRAKSCAYHPVLSLADRVLYHTVLPKVGAVLMKTSLGNVKLSCIWVLKLGILRPMPQVVLMQGKYDYVHWM